MGRFLLGLLVASGLFWTYTSWGASDPTQPLDTQPLDPTMLDSKQLDQLLESPAQDGAVAAESGMQPGSQAKDAAMDPPQQSDSSPASGEPETGSPSAGQPEAGRVAGGPAKANAAVMGFIHSEAGRNRAREAQEQAMSEEPPEALRRSTLILETCMREKIGKEDLEAQALVNELYARHLGLVRQVPFNPANGERAYRYRVAAGDSLDRIAARYRKSHEIQLDGQSIAVINRIGDPRSLQKDQLLRIPTDRIHVVVVKNSHLCGVYLGSDLVRLYWCSLGKPGHETPVTSFVVSEKIAKPDWYYNGLQVPYGSKDNPLGTHFVKFKHDSFTGFGIHGTTEPDRMVEEVSLGCIRLLNPDIEEFFRLVPRGAVVRVQ